METLFYKEAPVERGFEYQSSLTIFGLPFVHVSFKYRKNRPVPARGIVAIGQFACGFLVIGQFAAGAIALGQFTVGLLSAGQFAVGYAAFGEFALYLGEGHGPYARNLLHWLGR